MNLLKSAAVAAFAALSFASAAPAASAATVTVDLTPHVNHGWSWQSFHAVPTGEVTLAGHLFQIAEIDRTAFFIVMDDSPLKIDTSVFGATHAYTLLNTFWGVFGPNSYLSVTFEGDKGASQTFDLIGGVDMRDFYNGSYTNTINGTTTVLAFEDGPRRIDKQTFALDPAFKTQTLTSVTFVDRGGNGFQRGALTGLTFATAGVPEPATWAVMIGGFGLVGGALRRRTKAAVA